MSKTRRFALILLFAISYQSAARENDSSQNAVKASLHSLDKAEAQYYFELSKLKNPSQQQIRDLQNQLVQPAQAELQATLAREADSRQKKAEEEVKKNFDTNQQKLLKLLDKITDPKLKEAFKNDLIKAGALTKDAKLTAVSPAQTPLRISAPSKRQIPKPTPTPPPAEPKSDAPEVTVEGKGVTEEIEFRGNSPTRPSPLPKSSPIAK